MMFSKPAEITAEYKIVTPLFLGGASQEADKDVFRTASFKGALRFWWRALNWAAVLRDNNNQTEQALKILNKEEGDLFGTASDGNNSRQSRFQLSTVIKGSNLVKKGGKSELSYLLCMGLFENKVIKRDYLSGGNVTVTLRFRPNTAPAAIDSVRNALIALGFFGGLGSRARKGFGSLAIQSINVNGNTETFNQLKDIEAFIEKLDFSAPADAPLSTISSATRIDASVFGRNSQTVHQLINGTQQFYRGFGIKKGEHRYIGNEIVSSPNFKPDHDNVLNAIKGEKQLSQLPERAIFGLPHNYQYSSNKMKMDINVEGNKRRASPLLIHIHQFPNGECVALQTLLQSTFLPKGLSVETKPKNGSGKPQKLSNPIVNWKVIHNYLDGFAKIDSQFKVLRHAQ